MLGHLIAVVKQHIRNYLDEIFDLIKVNNLIYLYACYYKLHLIYSFIHKLLYSDLEEYVHPILYFNLDFIVSFLYFIFARNTG